MPERRIEPRERIPVNRVKDRPVIHRHTDFRKSESPDRLVFLERAFMQVSEQIPCKSGRIIEIETVSRQETVNGTETEENAEDKVLPDAEYNRIIVGTNDSIKAQRASR